MPSRTSSRIVSSNPAFYANNRYAHRIDRDRVSGQYYVRRVNRGEYRTTPSRTGPYADIPSALAAIDADLALTRPSGVANTTITAGFTVPAKGATVVVPFAAATGYVVGMSVNIVTAGVYQITAIAGLSMTLKNLGYGQNVAPGTAITTGQVVSATAGPG